MLEGKKCLIVGIAKDQSIAWGCARAFRALGAEIAVTYLHDKARRFVEPLAEEIEAPICMPLDVSRPGQFDTVFEPIGETWGELDHVIHSVAFALRDTLAVPRQHFSDGKQKLGKTSKMGQRDIRRLLVIGATVVIRWAEASNETKILELLKAKMREAWVATCPTDMAIRKPREDRIKMCLVLGTHGFGVEVFRTVRERMEKAVATRHAFQTEESRQSQIFPEDQIIAFEADRDGVVPTPRSFMQRRANNRSRRNPLGVVISLWYSP